MACIRRVIREANVPGAEFVFTVAQSRARLRYIGLCCRLKKFRRLRPSLRVREKCSVIWSTHGCDD